MCDRLPTIPTQGASRSSRRPAANTNSGNLGVIAQVQAGTPKLNGRAPVFAAARPAGAVGDATYQGLFIRDYVGQTPSSGNQTGSVTDCPDIWPSGQTPLADPQTTLDG